MEETVIVIWWFGYIGSHIVVELQKRGYEVVVIDDMSNCYEEVGKDIFKITWEFPDLYEVDLRYPMNLERIFGFYQNIVWFINAAGFSDVQASIQDNFSYYSNNTTGCINLLNSLIKHNIKNFVFISSAYVYDMLNETLPFKETDKISNYNPYATSYIMAETVMKDIVSYYDMNIVSLRCSNVVGSSKDWMIGENQVFGQNLSRNVLIKWALESQKVSVYGNNYDTKDWTCVRDFVHVEDVARACADSFELSKIWKLKFEILNVGTWVPTSVIDFIEAAKEVTGKEINYEFKDARIWEAPQIYLDINKIYKKIGWSPQNTLKEALEDAWNFIQNNEV